MPNRRRLWAAGLVAIGIVVLLTIPASSGPISANSRTAALPTASVHAASSCTGAKVPAILSGVLQDEGTLVPRPVVTNVTIVATVDVETNETTKFGTSLTCTESTLRESTNGSGGFVLNFTLPGPSCGPTECLSYSGPYTPTGFRVSGGTAPGYFLKSARNGSTVTIDWVAALSAASTSPNEFGTVSVDAPTSIGAYAWDGAGDPASANVTYAWQLAGTGWVSTGAADAATFSVNGTSAGSAGTVTLWVNGSFNGTGIALAPVHLYLSAVSTELTGAEFNPTSLDVGVPADVTVSATGSEGYVYSASLTPGLDASDQTTACRTTSAPGGTVDIQCGFTIVYGIPGIVQPAVTVTNGYSPVTYNYPDVTVSSALAVSVGPDPAEGYAGVPVDVSISVVAHTGTGPYGPACLLTGDDRFLCDLSPGPSWTIPVSYRAVGSYAAVVTVADSAGTNRTVPIAMQIADQPSVPAVSLSSSSVGPSVPVTASAALAGGAFPLSYWWNTSDPHGTLYAGVVSSDAIPSVTFTPGSPGPEAITLTVVDALGTVVSGAANLTVLRPVVGLAASAPQANGSTPAGSPVAIALTGVDSLGHPVLSFSTSVSVVVNGSCGESWLNRSGTPILLGSSGNATLSAASWTGGSLALTLTASQAGLCAVAFSTPQFPVPVTVEFQVSANISDLRLVAPEYVHPGTADNATRYSVVDEFGNPDLSGYVIVQTTFGALRTTTDSTIQDVGGRPSVWVNYSATGTGPGTLTVLSERNVSLLALRIAGTPASVDASPLELDLGALVALVVGAVAVGWVARSRRRRSSDAARRESPEDPDELLRRLAEGRSHVLSRLAYDRDTDLDGAAAGFPGPPPDAAELAEWIGTLVTEGLVRPSVGPDGRPQFRLANPDGRPGALRVEVDPLALDAALARRELNEVPRDDDVGRTT
jgi:hypothetical protein